MREQYWQEPDSPEEISLEDLATLPVAGPAGVARQALVAEALDDEKWLAGYRARRLAGTPAPESLPVVTHYGRSSSRPAKAAELKAVTPSGAYLSSALVGAAWSGLGYINPYAPDWLRDSFRVDPSLNPLSVLIPGVLVGLAWAFAARRSQGPWVWAVGAAWAATAISVMATPIAGAAVLLYHYRNNILETFRRIPPTPLPASQEASEDEFEVRKLGWNDTPPRTSWGDPAKSATTATWALVRRADDLGLVATQEPPIEDLVAAVIGAEAWLLSTGATEFAQAASFGPRSLGALAAVYARATGQGEPVLVPVSEDLPWPVTERQLHLLIPALWAWSIGQVGEEAARRAFRCAASDLAWGGGGSDRCSRVASRLWAIANEPTPLP